MAASSDLILRYFPHLTTEQQRQFRALYAIYRHWNDQINVISRKDITFFYERHVLHSLGIAMVIHLQRGTSVIDVGTGGGFPGIPLAIAFPEVDFLLVDAIGKKIKVVNSVKEAVGLKNVTAVHGRVEALHRQFDFAVSRSVTQLPKLMKWVSGRIKKQGQNGYPNGIFYLKGGDFDRELSGINRYCEVTALSDYFEEDFFATKKVVYIEG